MKRTLFGKFFLSSLLILAVTYAVLFASMSQLFSQFYLSLKERELKRRGELIASVLTSPTQEIPETVKRLSEGIHVLLVPLSRLFAPDSPLRHGPQMMRPGAMFRRVFPLQELENRLRQGKAVTFQGVLPVLRQEMLVVALPLPPDAPPQAVLFLSTPLADIQMTVKAFRYLLLWSGLVAFPLAVILAFLFSRSLSVPLKKMRTMARAIASGDYTKRLEIPPEEELGQLARDFNTLSQELERTIRTLEREKREIENILLALKEGVVALDLEGRILSANPKAQEVFETPLEGKARIDEVLPQDVAMLFQETLKSGVATQGECVFRSKRLIVRVAPLEDEGVLYGAVGVIQDITELRRAEELRRQFIADVSHELKTPLTAIQGFLEAVLDGVISFEEFRKKYLPLLYEETLRMSRLIRDLLDLSLMESGKVRWEMEPVDLAALTREVVLKLTPLFQEKRVNVENHLALPLVVFGNRDRLAQVLTNLLHNAILFSPEGSTVTIEGEEREGMVTVSVLDEGPGIPENDLPFIFERFYRVEKSRSRKGGGVGLGLAIVREIVERHGGTVGVENRPQGGSRFFFTLKRAFREDGSAQQPGKDSEQRPLQGEQ